MLKERVIPFLNYRYFAYALSLGLFVIFMAVTMIFKDGLVLGVDFVGGLKIIAKFEKGVNEAKIRSVLTAHNPLVQQIGEAEINEYIISTKLTEDSVFATRDKLVDFMERKYPRVSLNKEDAVLVSFGIPVDEGAVKAKLAGMDATVQKIRVSGKDDYIIYKKEAQDKKKSKYNSDTITNMLRGGFQKIDILNGLSIVALFDKPVTEEQLKTSLKDYNVTVVRADQALKNAFIIYKIAVDESDKIRSELEKNFKKAQVLSVESVGPAVGSLLRQSALKLIIISILLMTIYLAYRFEFRYSVGAMVAVLHDVILSVAFCGFMGIEINIPVIAALLTIFGYSVNDTIVIFDRIRESTQIESKMSFIDIINKSITLTFSRTILTSYLTLLTVFALFLLGGEGIDDFALVLLFGMIIGVYSTVYIASPVVIGWEKLVLRLRRS
jgi:preprotein translocase subunit SecF